MFFFEINGVLRSFSLCRQRKSNQKESFFSTTPTPPYHNEGLQPLPRPLLLGEGCNRSCSSLLHYCKLDPSEGRLDCFFPTPWGGVGGAINVAIARGKGKNSANECKESLLSICRVQPILFNKCDD